MKALNLMPAIALNYVLRGTLKLAKKDLSGALVDYDKAIELKPDYAQAYCGRGEVEAAEDRNDAAIADYNRAIKLNPDYAESYVHRGMVKEELKNLDGALSDYNAAIKLKPDNAEAYYFRALVKSAKHNTDGAMNDLNKAIDLNPANAVIYIFRGDLKVRQHNLDGAIADFDEAISRARGIEPVLAQAYSSRGAAKEVEGDSIGAFSDAAEAIELNPKDAMGYYLCGHLNYNSQRFVDALADLRMACQLMSRADMQDYTHFYIWLAKSRLGEQVAATKELEAYWSSRKKGMMKGWPSKICEFLTGHLTEASLFDAAEDSDKPKSADQLCEAYFYAGSKRLIAGDKMTAVDYFKKCTATGRTNNDEYVSAVTELRILKMEKPNY